MIRKSQKIIETEKVVDEYIEKNGSPPTYKVLASLLGISTTATFFRCANFRDKMATRKPVVGWIKVTDQLPEPGKECWLGKVGDINVAEGNLVEQCDRQYEEDYQGCKLPKDLWATEVSIDFIKNYFTHWQYKVIPEPPKE